MRLREAMVYAIRYDAQLEKQDRSDRLRIEGIRFVSSDFRSKYQRQPEVRLNAEDCLSEDWILWKDGKEFIPKCCQD
jgi:hypothetical protein